jgi:hypothetical protein
MVSAETHVLVDRLDDDIFVRLISGLPQLRRLSVDFGATQLLTLRSLCRVSVGCRMLETLELGGRFRLNYLQKFGEAEGCTLFPGLERLKLRGVYVE